MEQYTSMIGFKKEMVVKHPEEGKIVDMNESVRKDTGVKDARFKIYPISGYGNQELVRHLINIEKPDQ